MRIDLRKRIFLNFVLVIAVFGILGAILGQEKGAESIAQIAGNE